VPVLNSQMFFIQNVAALQPKPHQSMATEQDKLVDADV